MNHELDKMKLPIVNEELAKSNSMSLKLDIAVFEAIKKVELENNYKFETYEIDSVLLKMISKRHDRYVLARFKEKE